VSHGPGHVVPFSFDLSVLVRRSVATLYSNLITRPTGRALRLGIESQIGELGSCCVSILDFTQVVVLDYSCADEAVAKLILRYQRPDRPADAYFVARGLGEQHWEPIEEVLQRHGLALVAEVADRGYMLLGQATPLERSAWDALERVGSAQIPGVAVTLRTTELAAAAALEGLLSRRVVLRGEAPGEYRALTALLAPADRPTR
jgi:hypothetical protein